jgi:protein ImuB
MACSARAVALGVTVGMPLAEALALAGQAERETGEGRKEKREEGGAKRQSQMLMVNAKPPAAFPLPSSPLAPHPSPLTPRPSPLAPGLWPLAARPSDPLTDRQALEALAEWCGRFSPIVGLENSPAPESLLLDVTGLVHLFDGETSLAERIVHDFTCRGLAVRVAVADTIGAAWAMAHSQQSAVSNQQSAISSQQSAVSSQHSAFTLVPPGEVLPAVRPLPVAALRLPEDTVELLRGLGIDRIGQLEALPRDELSSRFGPQLLTRWDQAMGRLAEPIPVRGELPKLEADWSPESPATRRETAEAALEQLIGQVAEGLLRLGRGALRLECRLDCISGGSARAEPVQLSVGLFRPTAAAGHLSSLARMQLERLRLPGPLVGMHVTVAATAPLPEEQQELFFLGDGWSRRHARYLAELIERLSSRLGRRLVLRVRLVSDAQPELAFRYDPVVGDSRRRAPRGATTNSRSVPGLSSSAGRGATGVSPVRGARHGQDARGTRRGQDARGTRRRPAAGELPPRPLRLLRRPVALAVTSVMPDGPPVRFHFGGRDQRIAQHWGPERIETGWWRNRVIGRDYYQIETATGHRYWLFRRLRDGRWFLHGTFE